MDVHRPDLANARRRKRLIIAAVVTVLVAVATFGVSRLKPAAPEVESGGLFIDTVKRGSFVRQVRGTGVLVPEQVRWIPAATEARVERILVRPGTVVKADTVLLELSNPEVEQAARDAELQLGSAVAELRRREIELQSAILSQQALAADIEAQRSDAESQAAVDDELARNGLTSELDAQALAQPRRAAPEPQHDREAAPGDRAQGLRSRHARCSARASISSARCTTSASSRGARLQVRAGIDGVLQQLPVEVGQRVAAGTNLARVAQPMPLKAELRIAETQARDVAVGQPVTIDTRNGTVIGRVTRVDPAVQNGTIGVDVGFDGALPRGARPDLTVDGVIELERLDERPLRRPSRAGERRRDHRSLQSSSSDEAVQTSVAIGRTSVSSVEIRSGLKEGDRVILSDMSAWSEHPSIRLK